MPDTRAQLPRFVVLEHDHPRGRHWDFMLEVDAALKTWALAAPPDASGPIAAAALPDHRLAYLEYEGPVSGDRGSVSRWDHGTFRVLQGGSTRWVVVLEGQRLHGQATLECQAAERWTFALPSDERGASDP